MLNTSKSITIRHCQCDSMLTASATHCSWSSDELHQSDCISPKVLSHDLSQQLSFLALIIVTQSLQVYQQIWARGYSEHRTMQHILLWKQKTRSHNTSPKRTGLRLWLWPTAILVGLYLHISLHLSALTNQLNFSNLHLKYLREHYFSFMVLSPWNSQPANLRNLPTLPQIKSKIKTFLFTKAFS